jgi:hypothetical protein
MTCAQVRPGAPHFPGGAKGGAKGTRTPLLTRENAVQTAVSMRLVPVQYRSLPAVSLSGLDGVKRRRRLFDRDHPHPILTHFPGSKMVPAVSVPGTTVKFRSPQPCQRSDKEDRPMTPTSPRKLRDEDLYRYCEAEETMATKTERLSQ